MLNAHDFNLFITPGSLPPVLHMGQYDSGRQWTAKLKNRNGEAYTPPSGATATIAGTNKKRVSWILNADISGSSVTFTPEGAATDQFGKMQVTLTIEANGEQITALALIFDIQKAGVTNEEAATSPEFETAMQAAAAEAVEDAMTEAGILFAANQDAKSNEMTQPVGVDGNGKLWTTPGEGGGSTEGAVLYNQSQSLNSTQKSQARSNIGAGTYSKAPGGIPATDMAQAVQTALTAAGTAVQPSALSGYVPTSVFAAVTPSADLVEVKRDTSTGKLYVLVNGGGGGSGDSNTVLITMTESGSDLVASKTSSEIYTLLSGGAVNLVLIDYAGRQGTLVKKPVASGGGYTDAKFWAFDELNTGIIAYSINSSGLVSEGTIPLAGFYIKPSGGIPQTDLASALSDKINGALQTGNLASKTSAMTQAVGYDSTTGKLFTAPGSGGGGVTIYSVQFVYRSGYWYIQHDGSDIAAEDIFTALFGGDLVQVVDDAGAECELMAVSYTPGVGRLVYKSSNVDNGVPEWRVFTIQDEIVQGAPRAEVTMTAVDLMPLSDSRTASAVASGFTVAGNTVYTVSGTIAGFKLTTNLRPTMLPGQFIEIRLTVGSTAITTATWPSWCNLLNGWDGNFAANTYYKIMIDDAGNVVAGTREVTA